MSAVLSDRAERMTRAAIAVLDSGLSGQSPDAIAAQRSASRTISTSRKCATRSNHSRAARKTLL